MAKEIRFLNSEQLYQLALPAHEIEFAQAELTRESGYLRQRLEGVQFSDHKRVLDCACGVGHWTAVGATLNERVIGLDYNYHRLQIAQAHAQLNALHNMDVMRGDMHNLPFRSNSFDAVFCYSALMFVRPKHTLQEFVRILKPGGILYVNANGAGWYWIEFVKRAWQQRKPKLLRSSLKYSWRTIKRRFGNQDLAHTILNRQEVSRMFESHGLQVIGACDEGRFGTPANLPAMYAGRYGPLEGIFEVVGVKRVN